MAGEAVVEYEDAMWRSFLRNAESALAKPQKVLAVAYGTRGYRDIIEHFDDERGPSGAWKDLSPARRRQRGQSARILQDTGNLRHSISPANYRDVPNGIKVFAAAPYGGIHDRGSSKKNIPQRSFMWLSAKALADMAKIVLEFVSGKRNA